MNNSNSNAEQSGKRRLLLVEDDHDLRSILAERLESLNVEVIAVQDGEEAMQALDKKDYHIVVTDIGMPNVSGLELIKKVRSEGKQTPFIFVSAYDDKDRILEALRYGAHDFLPKPIKSVQLLASIQKVLDQVG